MKQLKVNFLHILPKNIILSVSTLFVLFICCFSIAQSEEKTPAPDKIVVNNVKELKNALNSIPKSGGTIFLKAGKYILKNEIHISKSNVSLEGERGTILYLADKTNKPVILIGSSKESPTYSDIIRNISISNIEINGNKDNQESEFSATEHWIRNNGIDIRAVDNLWINNVDIYNARSGGIVASWNSSRIFISNSSFRDNYFDGIALYDSKDLSISNFISSDNTGAGISLDNKLNYVNFNGGFIKNNDDVGIFLRDSENISFHNIQVANNGNSGVFMSHRVDDKYYYVVPDTGVKNIFFQGCKFIDNKGYGIILSSPIEQSFEIAISSCVFSKNQKGSMKYPEGTLFESANIKLSDQK